VDAAGKKHVRMVKVQTPMATCSNSPDLAKKSPKFFSRSFTIARPYPAGIASKAESMLNKAGALCSAGAMDVRHTLFLKEKRLVQSRKVPRRYSLPSRDTDEVASLKHARNE